MNAKAGRGSDQFMVRLPDGLRDRIKAKAEINGRSMNAEIVEALERHFPRPLEPKDVAAGVAAYLGTIEPDLRKAAIELIAVQAKDGNLARHAHASALMERDAGYRFPWDEDD